VGRGHVGLAGAVAAVVVSSAPVAPAATRLAWTTLATGTTAPSGSQSPTGRLAYSPGQLSSVLARVRPDQRPTLRAVDFSKRALVGAFLDGLPCGQKVAVTSMTYAGSTLTMHIAFTPPPIGVAACVRDSTPYEIVTLPRSALGKPLPTHVTVVARARA
jgi:hypothetical protein